MFPWWPMALSIFSCVYYHLHIVYSKISLLNFCQFLLNCLLVSFKFFIYSVYKLFMKYTICKYFLSICHHLVFSIYWGTKIFNFDETQFIGFFFYGLCFGVLRTLCSSQDLKDFLLELLPGVLLDLGLLSILG